MSARAWSPSAPRFALFDAPSPLQRLPRFSAALRRAARSGAPEVWMKREDLLPVGLGGNKLRNLEFHLGAAIAAGADVVVTSGRRWSNHCRLTAAAGARAGLAVELVLSGPPAAVPGINERLDVLFGAHVRVAPSDARADRERLVAETMSRLAAEGRRPYLIPVGGSGIVGVIGQVLAGLELARQLEAAGMLLGGLILPTATGGTQAGLLVGLRHAGLAAPVLGMAVGTPAAELAPIVAELAAGVAGQLDPAGAGVANTLATRDWSAEIDIDDRTIGEGYGRRSAAGASAALLLARTEGIVVDPVYTAKALGGLIELAREGRLDGAGAVVFWHAGGTPGVFETLPGDPPAER
ncbi:MAG: pyridoxal-phosphate dependent enzyme [Candidatus Limnocylindrales bacterium]